MKGRVALFDARLVNVFDQFRSVENLDVVQNGRFFAIGVQIRFQLRVSFERERDLTVSQGQFHHALDHPRIFFRRRFEHFQSNGIVVEEIFDDDQRSIRSCTRLDRCRRSNHAVLVFAGIRAGTIDDFTDDLHVSSVAERGQGFATKPVGTQLIEIVELFQLRGGESFADQRQIDFADATAIVSNLDGFQTSLLHVNVNRPCPGVETVLQQFFDRCTRPHDDLTGRDSIDHRGIEFLNFSIHLKRKTRSLLIGSV